MKEEKLEQVLTKCMKNSMKEIMAEEKGTLKCKAVVQLEGPMIEWLNYVKKEMKERGKKINTPTDFSSILTGRFQRYGRAVIPEFEVDNATFDMYLPDFPHCLIEVYGSAHESEEQKEIDKNRAIFAFHQGYFVLSVKNEQIEDNDCLDLLVDNLIGKMTFYESHAPKVFEK